MRHPISTIQDGRRPFHPDAWVIDMKNTILTAPVDIALRTMDDGEARTVRAWFDKLRHWDTDQDVRSHAHRLTGFQKPVYLLKADKDFRIFFEIDGDTVTILDVAKKATIYTSGHVPEGR